MLRISYRPVRNGTVWHELINQARVFCLHEVEGHQRQHILRGEGMHGLKQLHIKNLDSDPFFIDYNMYTYAYFQNHINFYICKMESCLIMVIQLTTN